MKFFITYDFEDGGCLHYLSSLSCVDGVPKVSFSSKRENALIFVNYDLDEIESLVCFLNSLPNTRLYIEFGSEKFKVFKYVYQFHKCRN